MVNESATTPDAERNGTEKTATDPSQIAASPPPGGQRPQP